MNSAEPLLWQVIQETEAKKVASRSFNLSFCPSCIFRSGLSSVSRIASIVLLVLWGLRTSGVSKQTPHRTGQSFVSHRDLIGELRPVESTKKTVFGKGDYSVGVFIKQWKYKLANFISSFDQYSYGSLVKGGKKKKVLHIVGWYCIWITFPLKQDSGNCHLQEV